MIKGLEELVNVYLLLVKKVPVAAEGVRRQLVQKLLYCKGQLTGDFDKQLTILQWLIKVDPAAATRYADEKEGILKRKNDEWARNQGKPVIIRFSAVNSVAIFGQQVSLEWLLANNAAVDLFDQDNLSIPHKNSAAVVMPRTANKGISYVQYKLVAQNEHGTDEAYFHMAVLPAPVLEFLPAQFPTFNISAGLSLNLAVPDFDLQKLTDSIAAEPSFYPEIMEDFYMSKDLMHQHKNFINTYSIYERLKRIIRTALKL